ncbi:MAG: HAD family hydrolase, partial [Candidatus Geothermarchaeales archaeon]
MTAIRLEYIYFDIDGTLCDYGLNPRAALRRVCEGLGIDAILDPSDYYELYKVVALERPGRTYEEVSNEAYRRLLERHGYGDAVLAREVADTYRRTRLESIGLYPETVKVLESISEEYPLGIISNGPGEIQWAKLDRFQLRDYFQTIVISGDVGVEKPGEAIFRLALHRARAKPGRSAHVGDSLRDDVKGALEAGLTSVWVNRGVLKSDG